MGPRPEGLLRRHTAFRVCNGAHVSWSVASSASQPEALGNMHQALRMGQERAEMFTAIPLSDSLNCYPYISVQPSCFYPLLFRYQQETMASRTGLRPASPADGSHWPCVTSAAGIDRLCETHHLIAEPKSAFPGIGAESMDKAVARENPPGAVQRQA